MKYLPATPFKHIVDPYHSNFSPSLENSILFFRHSALSQYWFTKLERLKDSRPNYYVFSLGKLLYQEIRLKTVDQNTNIVKQQYFICFQLLALSYNNRWYSSTLLLVLELLPYLQEEAQALLAPYFLYPDIPGW